MSDWPAADKLLIGAHTSAAGGVSNALKQGLEIGATIVQLFTTNQKRWQGVPIAPGQLSLWEETKRLTNLKQLMSHASYLINLASCRSDSLLKSQEAFRQELLRCHQLELDFLNFHPGSAVGSSEEAALEQLVTSLKQLAPLASKGPTRLLLETTAGQGHVLGYNFEQLSYLINRLSDLLPIGICLDTCHLFAAGYDLRTAAAWQNILRSFDQIIGCKHLYAIHVNDSLMPLGSRKDRHAPLGEGCIGLESFQAMMAESSLRHLPKYLETPGGPTLWQREIALLRSWAC